MDIKFIKREELLKMFFKHALVLLMPLFYFTIVLLYILLYVVA